jgi:arylsulfatase A-like enzyme
MHSNAIQCNGSDVGYHSDDSQIRTPFIDNLATQPRTLVLDSYYTYSLCSPSRSALLTGRYHVKNGMTTIVLPGNPGQLPADAARNSLAESLKTQGYRTAMVGKWHLGFAKVQYPSWCLQGSHIELTRRL